MKILVVGGTGHAGTFLVPKLLKEGHEVYVGTRGSTKLRVADNFIGAKFITLDSKNDENIERLADYGFDTVVDFPGSAFKLWQALKGSIKHLVACGSLWMFGYPHTVPTPEATQEKLPFEGYARRYEEILTMQAESGKYKAAFTAIMPPNFAGPGKIPLDCMGDRSAENHKAMLRGETVYLPNGPEALISPCDASDIASLFDLAINNPKAAGGELFNVGSGYAMPMSDFVRLYGRIYGKEIPIVKVSWEKYTTEINPSMGAWWHFYAHMVPDISKAKRLLGYEPQYTSEEAIERAVEWMKNEKII